MLTLPIKGKWFDMIESGEKREEYRALSKYYMSRFGGKVGRFQLRLRRGYCGEDPTLECEVSVKVGRGKPEWGAPKGQDVFILKIHKFERVDGRSDEEQQEEQQQSPKKKRSAISMMSLDEVMKLLTAYNSSHPQAVSYGQFVVMEECK